MDGTLGASSGRLAKVVSDKLNLAASMLPLERRTAVPDLLAEVRLGRGDRVGRSVGRSVGRGRSPLPLPMRPPHLAPPHHQAEFAAVLELYHGCQRERDVTCGRARRLTLVPASIAVTLAQRERHKDLLVALGQKVRPPRPRPGRRPPQMACPIFGFTLYTRTPKMDTMPEVQLFELNIFWEGSPQISCPIIAFHTLYKDAKMDALLHMHILSPSATSHAHLSRPAAV